MARNFFDGTDAELNTGSANFFALIDVQPLVYGLTTELAAEYEALNTAYATAYLAAINPETRTKGAVAAKNTAKAGLKSMAAALAKIIDGTPRVTDQQKIDLGLNVRKAPSPQPRPTVRPGVDVVSAIGRTVSIHIHDSASSSRRGKPAGTVAAWVYSFVGENYPSDPTLWNFQGSARKGKFEITFPNTLPGGTQVWVCAAWVNTTDETGPVSVPISTNLQGGGTSSASMKIAA